MNIQIIPWNGQPPYTPATWNDIQVAIQSGDTITVDGAIEPAVSVAGGYLIKGCPLNVLFGSPLTLAQAQVLVQNSGLDAIRNGSCYSQAVAMVSAASGTPKPPAVSVSNTPQPQSTVSDTVAQQTQPTTIQLTQGAVAAAVGPSINNALPSGPASSVGGQMLTQTYRFILAVNGGFATGANLQGCSQTNSAMCDPQFFNTLQDAINYAYANGQIPYKVDSSNDPWALMAGTMQIDPARVYNQDGSLGVTVNVFGIPAWMLIAAGVAVYLLTR